MLALWRRKKSLRLAVPTVENSGHSSRCKVLCRSIVSRQPVRTTRRYALRPALRFGPVDVLTGTRPAVNSRHREPRVRSRKPSTNPHNPHPKKFAIRWREACSRPQSITAEYHSSGRCKCLDGVFNDPSTGRLGTGDTSNG